ncbi:CatB-related O-acetyltransferase [Blastococcus saxobsidens]|uniref:Acetyltransferase-like isoleucine patch superfamily enzyme n=1 Tax=Blastococcus saxobsidens TaxID=138336 RepID=A0A4Q7YBF6_9ACTN|nr:CatB-related O-acetyltransferase [Blastococcus saxobsidens]RZU34557.1 acetyltransferase-like isoleucine patch superfamily enzyme [Blastococcus saxobsidens]
MSLTVVLVADTRASAVEASLHALVPAVEQAEAALGAEVEVLVIDSSGRTDVAAFLRTVDGARVVPAEGVDRAGALSLALSGTTADVVWFGGTEACAAPTALAAMVQVALRVGGLVVASPDDPAPHVAAPADLLRRLWASAGEGADPAPELVRRARAEEVPVIPAPAAGLVRERVRRPLQEAGAVTGPGTYAGKNFVLQTYTPLDRVEMGAYCSIADQVSIVLPGGRLYDEEGAELQLTLRGHHREQTASTFPISILVPDEPYDLPPPGAVGERLVIGDDVWIGYGATVLGEVTVGTGSIVGSRALVVNDVPPYSVVGGVPARVLRKRFEDDVVERLMRVRWWDWPEVAVHGAHLWFLRPVAEFLDHFDPGSVGGAGSTPPS